MNRSDLQRLLSASALALCLSGSFAFTLSPARALGAASPMLADDKKEEEPKGEAVDVDKLPKAVVNGVKKAYPGAVITKAVKLENGDYYLDDVKVGKKLWDLTVSPEGKIVKQVEMKEGA